MIQWASRALLLAVLIGAQPVFAETPQPPGTFSAAVQAVMPAVIGVTIPNRPAPTEAGVRGEDAPEDDAVADFVESFFGDLLRERPRRTVGAGVIVDPSGLVLTAAHGLRGITDIEAVDVDGTIYKATIAGVDDKTDLAVLRLAGRQPFPFARLGDSDRVRVGDLVVSINMPYGLGATVSAGIISAAPQSRSAVAIDELLRTDAATYTDSAGAPLVNLQGEVIGLSTVISGSEFGISFAIPSNMANSIYAELVRNGKVARASLGVQTQHVTPGLAAAFGLKNSRGLLVTNVSASGAASDLRPGDVLLQLNGRELTAPYELERGVRGAAPGQVAVITAWRDKRERIIRVTLATEGPEPSWTRTIPMLPFAVRPITAEFGVVVARVDAESDAAGAGLRAGDVVREINRYPIRTIADMTHVADTVRPGDWIAILVQRGRNAVYVAVTATRRRP